MKLQIHTHDNLLLFDIFGEGDVSLGDKVEIPGGAELIWEDGLCCKSTGIPEIVTFSLRCGRDVAVILIGNWLWHKFEKKETVRFVANGVDIENEAQLVQILEKYRRAEGL